MGQSYIGEIRMFGGNFAINGWAMCNGQILPISTLCHRLEPQPVRFT